MWGIFSCVEFYTFDIGTISVAISDCSITRALDSDAVNIVAQVRTRTVTPFQLVIHNVNIFQIRLFVVIIRRVHR
jgi:hypothetical protein